MDLSTRFVTTKELYSDAICASRPKSTRDRGPSGVTREGGWEAGPLGGEIRTWSTPLGTFGYFALRPKTAK